ncbi:ScpA family protein [Roseicella sp. DB1501]|uniref:segregation and condensation protein A n=1 Tax=Roseicella sp. DB1501 TaxID=2730925 RepID=UPI001492B555|nr:segregation/condensation protein A [Roseicella sp. DB1501]NOG74024.1 segregation/condensation protein A [Roseicella sp. DB1501]
MTPEVRASRAAVGNSGTPVLRLAAWEGPLDLLLELARAQRVDLARLSVIDLVGQFAAVLEEAIVRRAVPLSRLAEWSVMAAWLLALRARLLLPAGTDGSAEAEREAVELRHQLAKREAARRLADWLERRPQFGREVFARGAPEQEATAEPAADVTALLRACLRLLEVPVQERVYRPRPPTLWRVPDAMAHLRAMLAELPADGARLDAVLPPAPAGETTTLWRRSALASTLLASLELSRDGAVMLEQEAAFGAIRVSQGTVANLAAQSLEAV